MATSKVKVYYSKDRDWNDHLTFAATRIGVQDGCLKIYNDEASTGQAVKTLIADGVWKAAEVLSND